MHSMSIYVDRNKNLSINIWQTNNNWELTLNKYSLTPDYVKSTISIYDRLNYPPSHVITKSYLFEDWTQQKHITHREC